MPLEVLSSIEGAQESKAVNDLFEVIKKTPIEQISADMQANEDFISFDDLRADEVIPCPKEDKATIKANFPNEKKGYLVVSKVIPS